MIGGLVRDAGRGQFVRDVVRLHVLVVVVAAEHAAEGIRAALDDEVEAHAAGARLDVVARRRDLDFLEVVEVEIGRRCAGRGHVGDLDAVHRPAASCGRVPFDAKFDCWPVSLPPMLTRSTSTPGTLRISANGSRDVGIFVSSSVVKLVAVPVTLVSTIGDSPVTVIDSATVASFSDTEMSASRPTATITPSCLIPAKPGDLERHAVRAGRLVEEPELAGFIRHGGLGAIEALNSDRHAREHGFLLVGDGARNAAAGDLRVGGRTAISANNAAVSSFLIRLSSWLSIGERWSVRTPNQRKSNPGPEWSKLNTRERPFVTLLRAEPQIGATSVIAMG